MYITYIQKNNILLLRELKFFKNTVQEINKFKNVSRYLLHFFLILINFDRYITSNSNIYIYTVIKLYVINQITLYCT